MLESLVKYDEIERRPWVMFLWALLVSSIGVLFSMQLSYQIKVSGSLIDLTGLFSVIFTIIPSVYFLTIFIKRQESMDEKDIAKHYGKGFWHRHDRDILIFLFYFFGITFSFAFWAYTLPPGTFQIQAIKINEIRAMAGNVVTGSAGGDYITGFMRVFINNLQVMGFAFVFSLLFGAGAVFIVVWNASILGVYIGRLAETVFHIPGESLKFIPHGVPEIAGYLFAGLAGGIISAAVIRGHKKEIVSGVIVDAFKLVAMAFLFVFLGALIETMDFYTRIASIFVFYTIFIYIITIAITPSRERIR